MGSDEIAVPLLEWLVTVGRTHAVVTAIYTQPDRAVGRGQRVQPNAIKRWAMDRAIPVRQPDRLTAAVREELAAESPDLALVMAYGHILRDAFIATPRRGTLNLHASILPAYRGASPIQSAIAAGEAKTGVSLMRIVRELDAGPVADIETCPILPTDTAVEVEAKMAAACVPLIARNLPLLAAGTLQFVEQDHARASYCRKLTKSDGALDFSAPASELAARINGLHPWPGCHCEFGGQTLRLGGASLAPDIDGGNTPPGTRLATADTRLCLATGQGALELTRLQRPGGRMLPAADFLRGFEIPTGAVVPSQPMTSLITPAVA